MKVRIFGIISRATNSLILYPVDRRDEETLLLLTKKHVAPGARIFSDNWTAYINLNDKGFEHFTVCHKTNVKAVYKNMKTNEEIECCTNNTECACKHAKDHFKRINGCGLGTFEGHLSEVVCMNHVKHI